RFSSFLCAFKPLYISHILEKDQEVNIFWSRPVHWMDLERHALEPVIRLDSETILPHWQVAIAGIENGRAQLWHQSLASHGKDVHAHFTRGGFKEDPGMASKEHDLHVGVDHDSDRPIPIDDDSFGFALEVEVPAGFFARGNPDSFAPFAGLRGYRKTEVRVRFGGFL